MVIDFVHDRTQVITAIECTTVCAVVGVFARDRLASEWHSRDSM